MLVLVGKKNLGAGNYQQMLPTLSVPPLTMTLKKFVGHNLLHFFFFIMHCLFLPIFICNRYLDSVKPLLSPEEYVDTEKVRSLIIDSIPITNS